MNQDDYYEKYLTVAWMPEIFRKATTVGVWLADDSALEEVIGILDTTPSPKKLVIFSASLLVLLQQRIWTRRWIFSELACNANIVVCCSRHQVPWVVLANFVEYLCFVGENDILPLIKPLENFRRIGDLPSVTSIRAIAHYHRTLAAHPRVPEDFGRPIAELVFGLNRLVNDMPEDNIYALLPMSADYIQNLLSVDNGQPSISIYPYFVQLAITATQNIDVICQP